VAGTLGRPLSILTVKLLQNHITVGHHSIYLVKIRNYTSHTTRSASILWILREFLHRLPYTSQPRDLFSSGLRFQIMRHYFELLGSGLEMDQSISSGLYCLRLSVVNFGHLDKKACLKYANETSSQEFCVT
jgi:hypothetical protein